MKNILIFLITIICFQNITYSQNIFVDFSDRQQYQKSNQYLLDKEYWMNQDLNNVTFGTLFMLYKRRIIDEYGYATRIMNLSRNQKLCEIYNNDSVFNIKRDLEMSYWAIRSCLSKKDLKVFYANLLYTIPANQRIGSLDDYLMEMHQRVNAPKNIFTLIFGE